MTSLSGNLLTPDKLRHGKKSIILFNQTLILMQTLVCTLLALFSFCTAPAFAHSADTSATEPLIVRSQMMPGGLEVLIANLEQENASITLVDLEDGQEIFTDRIRKHNGYSYNLNFDKLAFGRYQLEVKKGKTVRKQVILKAETGVVCSNWK